MRDSASIAAGAFMALQRGKSLELRDGLSKVALVNRLIFSKS